MMDAKVAALRPESRTLLIPLAGRVHAARVAPELDFTDPQAMHLSSLLGLDLNTLAADVGIATGSVRRAMVFDRSAAAFIERHPNGRVVNLGAGLCTRASRIGFSGEWIDVDFPDVLALRRAIDPENATHRYLALDCDAPNASATLAPLFDGRPTLVIAEGVLMFLAERSVRGLMQTLAAASARNAPGSLGVLFDYLHPIVERVGPRLNRSLVITGGRYHWSVTKLRRFVSGFAPLHVVRDDLFSEMHLPMARRLDAVARAILGGSLFNVAFVQNGAP